MNPRLKVLLYELTMTSTLGTARWRSFLPLSTKGLVEIDDGQDQKQISAFFGASYRNVKLTPKGRSLALSLARDDADAWETARQHAADRFAKNQAGGCLCASCCAVHALWWEESRAS